MAASCEELTAAHQQNYAALYPQGTASADPSPLPEVRDERLTYDEAEYAQSQKIGCEPVKDEPTGDWTYQPAGGSGGPAAGTFPTLPSVGAVTPVTVNTVEYDSEPFLCGEPDTTNTVRCTSANMTDYHFFETIVDAATLDSRFPHLAAEGSSSVEEGVRCASGIFGDAQGSDACFVELGDDVYFVGFQRYAYVTAADIAAMTRQAAEGQ